MNEPMQVLVLSGGPYEIGLAHGRAWAGVIRRLAEQNLASLSELSQARGGPAIAAADVYRLLQRYIPLLERHVPDLCEEARGIADGAGLDLLQVLSLNGFLDLFDLTFPDIADRVLAGGGCTTFGVSGPRNRWAFLGQNYDIRAFFQPGVFLMDLRPKAGPRALVPTVAGMLGCCGLNEAGVGVMINNLTPRDPQPGVLHQFMVRNILAQERIGDAVNAVTGAPRASGFNYLLGDRSGELIGLETSATRYEVYLAEPQGFACHCNHYVTPALREMEGTPDLNGDSIARYGRARRRLLEVDPDEPLADLQAMCRDHTNHPYSICRHPTPAAPYPFGQGQTVFSVICDLLRSELHVCLGNPCTGQYTVHALG